MTAVDRNCGGAREPDQEEQEKEEEGDANENCVADKKVSLGRKASVRDKADTEKAPQSKRGL